MKEKLKSLREKYLPYDEGMLRRLAWATTIMFAWILIWALIFKLGDEAILVRNYLNLKNMTFEERILWDLIPFNYRGTDYWKTRQVIVTILNCFIFAPFGITFCYIFKKKNAWRDAAICLGISFSVEMIQLFTVLGNPATEDLITNVAGCFIGFGLYQLLLKRLSLKRSVQFFAVATALFGAATIFSLVSTVNAADTIFAILTKAI